MSSSYSSHACSKRDMRPAKPAPAPQPEASAPTEAAPVPAPVKAAPEVASSPEATYVSDVTYPDDSVVQSGTIVKQWRMRNSGAGPWPQDTKVKCDALVFFFPR